MAFLTGSMAYGIQREGSDVDVAILLTQEELTIVLNNAKYSEDKCRRSDRENRDKRCGASLVFANLNLIIFTSEAEYNGWKLATAELKRRRPVTRQQAIETIDLYLDHPLNALVGET